jgi:micrococcal nuclease
MTKSLYYFLIFLFPLTTSENEMRGTVVAVFDGNSLEVSVDDDERYRIVLLGIDCPELGQEYGEDAASFVQKKMLGSEVLVKLHGKDRSKNYIGVVLLEDGTDVRVDLLERGLAWTAERDPIAELESHRLEAMKKRRGLWACESPIPPWIYRRQQSMSEPKTR